MSVENEIRCERLTIEADDGHRILLDCWQPRGDVRALIHVFHGLGEHAARYDRFARQCLASGYAVAAHNHRGHGENCLPDRLGHFASRAGWDTVINDALRVQQSLVGRFENVPLILFGHSMGSFIAQSLAMRHPEQINALVLSGSTWPDRMQLRIGKFLATIAAWINGPQAKSALLNKMGFGDFNKPFAPGRTEFDWLSRDLAEVDKYVTDPLCGALSSNLLWRDLLGGLLSFSTIKALSVIPDIPILITGGELDPVGGAARMTKLAQMYRKSGHAQVVLKIYAGARHEMLNETNRDEVSADIIEWCKAAV